MGFGKQLKIVLDEIDMSVATLSRETGIASTTLYSIIDRDTNNVGLDKVKKIEKAINAIPGGIIYNLLYGITPENAEVSTRQYDYYAMGDEARRYWMLEKYNCLTPKGQAKVAEYTEDLAQIPEYQKGDTNHLQVNAAHERTDIEATNEMRQQDEELMNDDKHWN